MKSEARNLLIGCDKNVRSRAASHLLVLLTGPEPQEGAMRRCLKVKDRGFSSAAKWCKGLRELRMYACAALTDQTLTQLGTHLHDLRVLDCCGANAITGA